jgi:molybdopterin synthase catalytic subunit
MKIAIQHADFEVSTELKLLRENQSAIGGINVFVGTVRDMHLGESILAMELEHYPGMTEKSLADIVKQAQERWEILNVSIIHRIGKLLPGDQIVLVAVASSHRGDAYAASEFIMDYLKTSAPFWKKEYTPSHTRWVDARTSDEQRLQKWQS